MMMQLSFRLNPSEMGLNSMKEASLSSGGSAFLKSLGAEKGGNSKVYYKNVLKTASSALVRNETRKLSEAN